MYTAPLDLSANRKGGHYSTFSWNVSLNRLYAAILGKLFQMNRVRKRVIFQKIPYCCELHYLLTTFWTDNIDPKQNQVSKVSLSLYQSAELCRI